jgi:hypothetical protein
MSITSAYVAELKKLGIEWCQLHDDHVSGMSKYDIAQAAYLFLLENPGKSVSYAIAAIIADARRRVAMEHPLPDDLAETAAADDDHDIPERHEATPDIETAATVLCGGTAAAASLLRCSRRRVQQLLSSDPKTLARRLAAAAAQGELFGEASK